MTDKLIIFFIYLGLVVYCLIVFVSTWHLVMPESWCWLNEMHVMWLSFLMLCGVPMIGFIKSVSEGN